MRTVTWALAHAGVWAKAHTTWLLLERPADRLFLFLFLNDDSRSDHQHQAARFAADADVAEDAVDVGQLAEQRHAALAAAFAQPLDAAEQHRAAVGHAHRR